MILQKINFLVSDSTSWSVTFTRELRLVQRREKPGWRVPARLGWWCPAKTYKKGASSLFFAIIMRGL